MSIENKLEMVQKSHTEQKTTNAHLLLAKLFDADTFKEVDALAKSNDGFAEVVAGFGTVDGFPTYAFAQNSSVDGGAMSKAQGAKIAKVYDLAVKTGTPVVGIYDSQGARVKEGLDMLSAYGEMVLSSNNLSGVVPQISVIAGPCIGTNALLAVSADVVIMAKDAELTLETNGANATSDDASKLGVATMVEADVDSAIAKAKKVITMLPSNNIAPAPLCDYNDAKGADLAKALKDLDKDVTADVVCSVVNSVFDADSMVCFNCEFGTTMATALATIAGSVVGVVANKADVIDADGCAKAARFVRFCDAFNVPVISLVNAGSFSSLREASKLTHAYAEATTAKIALITGKAIGATYIAMAGRAANADLVYAWPTAVISAMNPEAATALMCGEALSKMENPLTDRAKVVKEYMDTECSPMNVAAVSMIEDVILPEDTRATLIDAIDMLTGKRVSRLPKKHSNIQM